MLGDDLGKDPPAQLKPNSSQIVVHGREGQYLMDKSKWPELKLPLAVTNCEEGEGLTQEESLMVSPMEKGGSGLDTGTVEKGVLFPFPNHPVLTLICVEKI